MKPGSLANVAAVFLAAGYIGAVLYQGNGNKLAAELSKEGRFLEFLVAVYIVWFLASQKGPVGKIASPLVTVGLVAAALVWISKAGVADAIRGWQAGNAGMFETVLKIFGAETVPTTEGK
jgi:hypothetical protein